jgi:hypothetical protein
MAPAASAAVIQNNPDTPISAARGAPATSETTKEPPMHMPITVIARVRSSSRVASASSAVSAAAIAPAPCSARPAMTPPMVVLVAATTLPQAKIARPMTMTGTRPYRSDSRPNGICSSAWVSP